jgi:Na+/melibiose symporter-like transporter
MPDRDFRRVLAAEGVSNFGAMLSRLAIPWLAALTLQATPLHMAALLVADVAAAAVAGLLLGRWVDRSGKRAVMLLCDIARSALLALLALAAWRGWLTMPALVAAAAASGVLTLGFELARSAWTAQCVAIDDLPRRNAQLATVGSLSETAAFALGGWLYQGLGAALALAVDACSYAVSALCLRSVREVHGGALEAAAAPTAGWRTVLQESAAGLRAVATRPALRALAGVEMLLALGMSMAGTSYMIFVARDLALPTGELGMIFALGGLGAVIGASLAPRLGRRFGPARAMLAGLVAAALGAACVPIAGAGAEAGAGAGAGLAAWVTLAWLAAHQVIGDAGHVLYDVHDRTLRQTAVPSALLARADAGIRSAGQFATLAGALAGGALGTAFGARAVMWLVVATHLAAAVLVAWRLSQLHAAPEVSAPQR